MSNNWEILSETGLQFFGKISASISHEIKNVLAIINENAGLLEDFTVMAEKGLPVDPQRLKTRAEMIMKQIRRGDEIIRGMNRFAHSVDEPLRKTDLNDTLSLMVVLSNRVASMRGVRLELEPASAPVPVVTNPFFLENLLWLCLDFAMNCAGAGKIVSLKAEKTERGAEIQFSGLGDMARMDAKSLQGERQTALLGILRAQLVIQREMGKFHVTFPTRSEG